MKNIKALMAAAIFILFLGLPGLTLAAIYKYVDDQGVTNFTDSLSKVPKEYRGRASLVKKEIQVENNQGGAVEAFNRLNGKTTLTWKDFMTFDKDGNAIGFNPRALFIQSLFESNLIYWLAAVFIFSFVAIVLLFYFRGWPTARGRKISLLTILFVWLVGGATITVLFVRPATREFFAISRGYLSQVIKEAPLDDRGKKILSDLDGKFADLQAKFH
jgi:hypothetical protein